MWLVTILSRCQGGSTGEYFRSRDEEDDICMLVDSDHSGDKISANQGVAFWYCNDSTVERSVICIEFVAMKQGIDALTGLRYKLRMMDIPISGPSYIYSENKSVLHNTSRPESVLRKKRNLVCYHAFMSQLLWVSPKWATYSAIKMLQT